MCGGRVVRGAGVDCAKNGDDAEDAIPGLNERRWLKAFWARRVLRSFGASFAFGVLEGNDDAAGVFDDVHRGEFFETEAGVVVAAASCFRSSQHLLHVAVRQRDLDNVAGTVKSAQPDAALKCFEGVSLHL